MLRPLALLGAALLALVLTGGCADDVSPAARVGDSTITTQQLLDEVGEWAGNDQTARAAELGASPSAWGYAMVPVASILQERIVFEIVATQFDDLGLELTEQMRDEALAVLFGENPAQADSAFAGFSDEYAESYVDDIARGVAVQRSMGEEGFLQLLRAQAQEVEVNPRFGTWEAADFAVVPPEGPRPASGAQVLDPLAQP